MLKRLLEKGRIVFKRAYCDWSGSRTSCTSSTARFEMVDIPRSKVRARTAPTSAWSSTRSTSATRSRTSTFRAAVGDSDFSPLVAKLKETTSA